MGLADLHIHTLYSWDGIHSVSAVLRHVVDHTDLDVIAITDHDEVAGAWETIELAPAYGVEVDPGSEISTAEGHLLALFLKERVEPGLSLADTVLRVGEQGGLCIAVHPMARGQQPVGRIHPPGITGSRGGPNPGWDRSLQCRSVPPQEQYCRLGTGPVATAGENRQQ